MAVQVFQAAKAAIPNLGSQLANGEFKPLREWLNENVHKWGSLYPSMDALLTKVCGAGLDPEIFLGYLRDKYSHVYNIKPLSP